MIICSVAAAHVIVLIPDGELVKKRLSAETNGYSEQEDSLETDYYAPLDPSCSK